MINYVATKGVPVKNFSFKLASITIILFIFLAACGGGAAPTVEESAPAVETSVPTVTEVPPTVPPPTDSPTTKDVSACKLPPLSFTNVGLGIPNPAHKLPALGEVKTVILFADFSDVSASQTPEEFFTMVSPDAETFFKTVSYGRMDWRLEPHFVWLRLSQPSAYYGEAIRSYEGHLEFIQEAVTLADADVDFSTADSVTVMVPTSAAAIEFGPAFGANPGEGYTADGKVFSNGVTSGADLPNWGFLWLNHETGHTMGLPDLYGYDYDPNNYDHIHRHVGNFGLMGFIGGRGLEPFAFERWQLGWLDDAQILCQTEEESTATVTPIENTGGLKAVMVPISNSKAVLIESRRQIGYDATILKPGVLVYVVDTSIPSGEGTLVVYPQLENDPYRDNSPLAVGESVTVEGVTVTVIESTAEGDTVQVTK